MTKMEKYASTEHKNTDKEWWENEMITWDEVKSMITFEEYCNNDLYADLEELQNNPDYQCSIRYNGKTYTGFSISKERNEICIFNDQGDSYSMDLNDFVEYVRKGEIKMNVTKIQGI